MNRPEVLRQLKSLRGLLEEIEHTAEPLEGSSAGVGLEIRSLLEAAYGTLEGIVREVQHGG